MQALPLFCRVPPARRRDLQALVTARTYERGNILFYHGNRPLGLYLLCDGRVKLLKEGHAGHRQIVRMVQAPDMLGDRSFFSQAEYACTGEVMEDSVICFLEGRHFWDLFGQAPETLRLLIQRFARELGEAEESMHCLAVCTVRQRTAAQLLRLRAAANTGEFALTESRTELAQVLGTTPEGVSRALADFRSREWIRVEDRRVRIVDEARLTQAACPHRRPAAAA